MDYSIYETSLVDYDGEICLCLNTGQCSNNCFYCYNNPNDIPIMEFDTAKSIINKKKQFVTAVSLTGGEPLLNPSLSKILEYAKKQNLKTKIDTSLCCDIDDNVLKNIDFINISIKNYKYLLKILPKIIYITKYQNIIVNLNIVYHPEYISIYEIKKINNKLKQLNKIVLVVTAMDISNTKYNKEVTKEDLLKLKEVLDINYIFYTKENGKFK